MSRAADVCVVDYGIGNVASVVSALRRIGCTVECASDGEELRSCDPRRIVMPGVGAMAPALRMLCQRGLSKALSHLVLESKVPFLGICVGMQVIAETCEEFGQHKGLGWVPGRVTRLAPLNSEIRLPHVGWNVVSGTKRDAMMNDVDGDHFYFVHSYVMQCADSYVSALSDYHGPFVVAIRYGNIRGVQFHPEKSSGAGERLLKAFLRTSHDAA